MRPSKRRRRRCSPSTTKARAWRRPLRASSGGLADRLDGDLLAQTIESGLLPLFLAAIGTRCGLDPAAAWEVLADPQGRGPALLLRAAGLERREAARILLALNAKGPIFSSAEGDATETQLELFDTLDQSVGGRGAAHVARPSDLPRQRRPGLDPGAAGGMTDVATDAPVTGRLDAAGRLIAADPPLAALQASAGGSSGGPLSVPQIAALARLAKRLGITVSRAAIAAEADEDVDLWVRAEPDGEEVALSITGWQRRPARTPAEAAPVAAARESDFLRASADWTWETDDTLRITSLSPGAAAAIGRLPADLIGRQITRLFRFHENAEGDLPLLAALAEHGRFEGQIAETRGGAQTRYLLSGVPLIDGMGRFAGFRGGAVGIAAGEDAPTGPVTADAFGRRLDSALREPIDRIVGQAEKLGAAEDGPLAADYAGYAADIAAAGRHLLALVDDLVDLQAIERPDFRPAAEEIDLADIARRAAGLLAVRAADKGVTIDGPDEGVVPATGDFTRALQIVVNLIGNAVRYTPEGGQVWLRVEREGDLAVLIVADQGKGIAAKDQERVFEKFERVDPSEPGGAGLGLYIARKLARAMRGDLAVHSAPGQGARFTLTLPAR